MSQGRPTADGSPDGPGLLRAHLARDVPRVSEREQVIEIVEMELGTDSTTAGADAHAGPQGLLQRLLGAHERRLLIGVRGDLRPALAAGLLGAPLRLADGPTLSGGFSGERASRIRAPGLEDGAPVSLGQLATDEQLEHLVGQIQQTDQVRDRDPAAAEAASELLL